MHVAGILRDRMYQIGSKVMVARLTVVMLLVALIFFDIKRLHAVSFCIRTNVSGPGQERMIPEYLSVTIGASLTESTQNWDAFDWNNTLVNTLAKGISPLFWRYGGTNADRVTYNITRPISSSMSLIHQKSYSTVTDILAGDKSDDLTDVLNSDRLSTMADFAIRNNWKWIFGLNVQKRKNITNDNPFGIWDSTNAQKLINGFLESDNNNIKNIIYGFELGNEPNTYPEHSDFLNITSQVLANDFLILKNTLDSIYNISDSNDNNNNGGFSITRPVIFGCDIATSGDVYLKGFLNASSILSKKYNNNKAILDGITWHHYYGNSDTYTLQDFISPHVLDSLMKRLNETIYIAHESEMYNNVYNNTNMYLGETSSTYNGGVGNLSSSFVAGFMWLDKLGVSSIYGMHGLMRQMFCGGDYGLIGQNTVNRTDFKPNPDYWSSLLFKLSHILFIYIICNCI